MTEARAATRVLVMADPKIPQITTQQMKAVALALDGLSHLDISREMGIDRKTVWNWFQREDVLTVFQVQTAALVESALRKMRASADEAVDCLVGIIRNRESSDKDRRQASVALLDRIGLGPTSKHEVTGKDGAPLGVVLKADEFEAERERLMAELEEARK